MNLSNRRSNINSNTMILTFNYENHAKYKVKFVIINCNKLNLI